MTNDIHHNTAIEMNIVKIYGYIAKLKIALFIFQCILSPFYWNKFNEYSYNANIDTIFTFAF